MSQVEIPAKSTIDALTNYKKYPTIAEMSKATIDQDTKISQERQFHVRVPIDVYRRLRIRCIYEGNSIQEYVIRLIQDSMGRHSDKGGSVLIVEDEAILRESLRDSLKDTHTVSTAASGEEALALIQKHDFDIVIADVRLGGKSGLQVVKEVKELKPYIKSIIITAYPSVELAVEAMKQGAVDYLVKPVRADDLERLIWGMLNDKASRRAGRDLSAQ